MSFNTEYPKQGTEGETGNLKGLGGKAVGSIAKAEKR
jgi:hypothetical protein